MVRAIALLAVALALVSCGDRGSDASAEDLAEARRQAQEALDLVAELRGDLDDLSAEVLDARSDGERLDSRFERATSRLEEALATIKESVKTAKGTADDASSSASAAAAQIAEAVRRLSVLEDRFDYHLKRYHGGG
ncbi:MAG: hypothetical protein ACLGHL_08180 [Actinomycetota bacterium]